MEPAESYIKEYLGQLKNEEVPKAILDRVKKFKPPVAGPSCPHCGKPLTAFKKPLASQRLWNAVWMSAALVSFALSFALPRYFFQFIAMAVLSGVKWIVDRRATKTQILIYKALQEDPEAFRRQQTPSRL